MVSEALISSGYCEQLSAMHARHAFAGKVSARHVNGVRYLAGKLGARTVLDYGSGPGSTLLLGDLPVREYDPAVLGKDADPQPADLVACIDVLEHVETDRLPAVLAHIYSLALMGAYIVVATRPADKRLPDGRNAHLTIDNAAWWREQIAGAGSWVTAVRHLTPLELVLWTRRPLNGHRG